MMSRQHGGPFPACDGLVRINAPTASVLCTLLAYDVLISILRISKVQRTGSGIL